MNIKPSRERSLYLLLAAPLIALLCVFALGFKWERDAAEEVNATLTTLTRDGHPVGNHSLTEWFDSHTTQQASSQWDDILVATDGLHIRFSDVLPLDDEPRLEPNQPWADAEIMQRYAEQARPIIEAIKRVPTHPRPVWQPVVFEGFQTTYPGLDETRSINRLLMREFRVAVDQQDPARAIHALQLMPKVADAFDWQIGILSDLIYFAAVEEHRAQIRESLAVGFWKTEESLLQLREQVNREQNLHDRWDTAVAAERAFLLAEFGITSDGPNHFQQESQIDFFPFGLTDMMGELLMERYQRWEDAETIKAFEPWPPQARSLRHEDGDDIWTYSILAVPVSNAEIFLDKFFGDPSSAAARFYRFELNRRWTLTAIAIKQFQKRYERFPNELSELSDVGLTESDWMVNSQESFGYEVGKGGKVAYLWSVDYERAMGPNGEPVVAMERPVASDHRNEKIEKWVSEIR